MLDDTTSKSTCPLDVFSNTEDLITALRRFRVDIETALGYGNDSHSFDHVAGLCLTGQVDTYILPNSVIIMELNKYPNHSVYHGFIAVGDLQEISDYHPTMEREARNRGAKYLSIAGRHGWLKPFKQLGWKSNLVIMHKEVPYGEDQ